MLTWLLIIFIVALAIAPILQMVPSKKQRRLARLREYAVTHGLFVEYRPLPGKDRQNLYRSEVLFYGKRIPDSGEFMRQVWEREEQDWQREAPPAKQELLRALPDSVRVVVAEPGGVGLYWDESGEEEEIDAILAFLGDVGGAKLVAKA